MYNLVVRILSVCKMNQARSIFSHALLHKLDEKLDIRSAGIFAKSGADVLSSVDMTSQQWGLQLPKKSSTNINELEQNDFEYALVAEEWMKDEVRKYAQNIYSYEDFAPNESFIPNDPDGLSLVRTEVELAKVFFCTKQFFNVVAGVSGIDVTAVVPFHENLIPKALELSVQLAREEGRLLVDADIRFPNKADLARYAYNPIENGAAAIDIKSQYLGISESHENPGNYYLSENYLKIFESDIYPKRKVIITPPINTLSGMLYDPFLASAPSSEVKVVV